MVDLADQAAADEGLEAVVDGGEGEAGHDLAGAVEDFVDGRVVALGEEDGTLHGAHRVGILRADIDVALGRPDGEARDGHAFDQQEGIALHDHTVGIGARIAFVGVADDVLPVGGCIGHGFPLDAGGEARAAATAQARLDHRLDGRRLTDAPRLFQTAAAAMGAIVRQRQGIDDTAAREGDAGLALEERDLLGPADAQRMRRGRQAVDEQAGNVLHRHRTEADAATGGLDLDQRLQPEQAARAGAHDLDIEVLAPGHVEDRGGDLVGADGTGGCIAWDVEARRHQPTSRAISSIESAVSRAIGSPSSIADGPDAHRPRQ